MTLESSLASKVTVIARDISVYCGRAAYRPFICTMVLSPVVLYM